MSTHKEHKQRLSTITTSAAISNANINSRRIKTNIYPQQTPLQCSPGHKNNQYDDPSGRRQTDNRDGFENMGKNQIYNGYGKNYKQNRRYSEQSVNEKKDKSIGNYRSSNIQIVKEPKYRKSTSVKKKQQFNNNIYIPFGNSKQSSNHSSPPNYINSNLNSPPPNYGIKNMLEQQQYINPDEYIQQLQQQKNRRIQAIYNPQSVSNSKINIYKTNYTMNTIGNVGSIGSSMSRNDKSMGNLRQINKINGKLSQIRTQLMESLKEIKQVGEQRNKSKSEKKIHERSIVSHNSSKNKQKANSNLYIPRILPVTFKKIQKLSTINQSSHKPNQSLVRYAGNNSSSKKINKSLEIKSKINIQSNAPNNNRKIYIPYGYGGANHGKLIVHNSKDQQAQSFHSIIEKASQKSKTPSSQLNMPYPKFNSFFDNYQKSIGNMNTNITNNVYIYRENQDKNIEMQNEEDHYARNSNGHQSRAISQSYVKLPENSLQFIEQEEHQKRGIHPHAQTHHPEKNNRRKKYKLKELQIFHNIDISILKAIKLNEGVYYGEVDQNGVKNGKGAIFYDNGRLYEGQFKNDHKQGYGYELYPDNSIYRGNFKEGKREGKGRFQWPNGQIYDGQWQNNLKHGSGLWQNKDSSASYLGQWRFGAISGFGVLTNQKGERYEGEFVNFNKQGHGAYRFQNGDRLVGIFRRNQPNGQCEYFWANGDYYKGDFSNGLRHGKGFIKYADGSYFEGEFRNDKKCGLGRQKYLDDMVYLGNYQNDLRHGFGKLTYGDIVYYEGYWLNNVAVIFQEHENINENNMNDEILEDDRERLDSVLENNLSSEKLKKIGKEQKDKILKQMKSKARKQKIQKLSSKNLLERLSQPKRGCQCCNLKYQHH